MAKIKAKIIGTGSFAPTQRMTNADFEKIVETTDEWIVSRTGIKERRIAPKDMAVSDMAVEACKKAIEVSGLKNEDIDLLIIGTVTPDYKLPSAACVVQEKMNLPNATAFDVVAACTGFINGLSVASALLESGSYTNALVVGAEKLSTIVNYNDRNTCVLFGDGAGAAVLTTSDDGTGVIGTYLKSDGNLRELLWVKDGGSAHPYEKDYAFEGDDKVMMSGGDIFKIAVKQMCNAAVKVLDDAGITADDIALIIPHQANIRIIGAIAKRLKVSMDKVFVNIENYGNTSAASVPIALDEAYRSGRIKPGDHVLMVAFGGGLIWGSALIKW